MVRLTLLEVMLSGLAAFLPVWQQLKLNVFRHGSSYLMWPTDQGCTVCPLTFLGMPCTTGVAPRFDGAAKDAAGLRLRISPAVIKLDSVLLELYSCLSWRQNAAVRQGSSSRSSEQRQVGERSGGLGFYGQ